MCIGPRRAASHLFADLPFADVAAACGGLGLAFATAWKKIPTSRKEREKWGTRHPDRAKHAALASAMGRGTAGSSPALCACSEWQWVFGASSGVGVRGGVRPSTSGPHGQPRAAVPTWPVAERGV